MPAHPLVIDLHTHSTCSDGTQEPGDVIRSAAAAGIDVVALTDHDVISGWTPASQAASSLGVTLVPGVELSTQVEGISVHILAYLIDPEHGELAALMTAIRTHRETRMRRTVDLLSADGYPVDYDAILDHVGAGVTLGRPHVADALVRSGTFVDRNAVFEDLLHSRSRYYVRHWAPQASDAVDVIRAAGGVPIMAHPFAHARGRTVNETVIGQLVEAGLGGLEVHHRDHDALAMQQAGALCTRWGLIQTGSSDYHGTGKSNALAEFTTDPAQFERILEQGSGSALMGRLP
ncbi:MAG: PHP domain-containing protein [Ornithinimicrobium sp.]